MMTTVLALSAQQQQIQRLKCGEVYTWDCAGEAYAIECTLCEEHPLCTLAEFPEHMQIWHFSWEETQNVEEVEVHKQKDAENNEVQNGECDVEQQFDLPDEDDDDDMNTCDSLEPFEQVLIADDESVSELTHSETEDISFEEEEEESSVGICDTTAHIQDPTELNVKEQIQYGLNEPITNTKLTSEHIEKLIELYKYYPRLWDQSHPEFSDLQLCRQSWIEITEKWNKYCKKCFTTTDVRIRISTLCQRYVKERERLENEGELDEISKFAYYKNMQFLDEQQTLQNRRLFFDQQNTKLLEIYEYFPILWHSAQKRLKLPEKRETAFRNISIALKLCGIHLSHLAIQRRLQGLRKCYRLEKIRHLHCKVEGQTFEPHFKHYMQMQFIDEHIDPFVCECCGKVFESIIDYREHMNKENHAECLEVIQQQEENEKIESEIEEMQDDDIEVDVVSVANEKNNNNIVQTDVNLNGQLQTFTDQCNVEKVLEAPNVQEDVFNFENVLEGKDSTVLDVPIMFEIPIVFGVPNDSEVPDVIESEHYNNLEKYKFNAEKEIMESIVTSTLPNGCNNETTGQYNKLYNSLEKEMMDEENDIMAAIVRSTLTDDCNTETIEQNAPSSGLVAKVDCGQFSYDLELNSNETFGNPIRNGVAESIQKENSESFARLTVEQTRELIALYKQRPQLWNPNHLDFHTRKLRRIAWRTLTAKINKIYKMRYSWKTLQRKLTDYVKYYKRERNRIETEKTCTKWCFYDDFSFMDDVIIMASELQKTLLNKEQNLQIIEIYKTRPQLWDTDHPQYTKRKDRQRHIEALCKYLLEECNVQVTAEKLRQRLIDFRCNYRAAKAERIAAYKRSETFKPHYEFYDALQFLDLHISPFICTVCEMHFKRRTDFIRHERKQHLNDGSSTTANGAKKRSFLPADAAGGGGGVGAIDVEVHADAALENICHICGIKFTLRSNLVNHLKRHLNQRAHACSMCPKRFFDTTALRVHECAHTKNLDNYRMCEQCGRSYVNQSKLNQHMKRHRNQRDYKCDHCDKAFFSAFERERHHRRHLNIRDKVCPICGKAFVIGSAYYAHMHLHSDVKRFSCKPCDLQFAQYAGLYKHRKKYHLNE